MTTALPTTSKPNQEPQLSLDGSVLYALVRLGGWPGLDDEDLRAAREALLEASVSELPARMRELAATGMPESIVPFRRDPLDVAFAAVLADVIVPAEFATDGSRVDAAFFRFGSQEVTYVDEVRPGRVPEPRLVDPPAVQCALNVLRSLPPEPMRYEVPDSDPGADIDGQEGADTPTTSDEVLRLQGAWAAPCLLDDPAPTVKLWLMRPGTRSRPPALLGEASCELRGDSLVLRRLKPEWLMELQAASLSGSWLQLTSRHFSCFGPLPDLLEPGSSRPVRFHVGGVLERGFGAMSAASVALDARTALRIVRHVPWAWMHEPAEFAAAAHFLEGEPEP